MSNKSEENTQQAESDSVQRLVSPLPCPFCGGDDIRFTNHGKTNAAAIRGLNNEWSMCCYQCGATFPNRFKKELLMNAWNNRI